MTDFCKDCSILSLLISTSFFSFSNFASSSEANFSLESFATLSFKVKYFLIENNAFL